MSKGKNENCLAGMRCPSCGSLEPFDIVVTTMARMFDDGTDSDVREPDWDQDSACKCVECGSHGPVHKFFERP